jgi:hypothetical protein
MFDSTMSRLLLFLLVIVSVSACTSRTPQPAPGMVEPTIPLAAEVLAAPPYGSSVSMIGYFAHSDAGAVLVTGLSRDGETIVPLPGSDAIWIDPAASIPDPSGDYDLVQISGTLDGPGAFGPTGSYRHALRTAQIEPLEVRELSFTLLLQNSSLYAQQPVRVVGYYISSSDSALLVESIGPGGVPDPGAGQIKLADSFDDPNLEPSLQGAGAVRYGRVTITGIWRDDRLQPLFIEPAE